MRESRTDGSSFSGESLPRSSSRYRGASPGVGIRFAVEESSSDEEFEVVPKRSSLAHVLDPRWQGHSKSRDSDTLERMAPEGALRRQRGSKQPAGYIEVPTSIFDATPV